MNWMSRIGLRAVALIAIVALAAVGCGGGGANVDKAGGSGEPVVLRMANTSGGLDLQPAVEYFVDRVEELSGGDVRIEAVDQWGDFASDAEQQVVRGVSSGEVELGWVGTRVFDTMGVKSFASPTMATSATRRRTVLRIAACLEGGGACASSSSASTGRK